MPQIIFKYRNANESFEPAERLSDREWTDTSFAESERAVGTLRMPMVNNGRYPDRHPILDVRGATVGFLKDGVGSLGYTFTCIYAGDCFWVANMGFAATMQGGRESRVSLVSSTGRFLFSRAVKFEVIKSFALGGSWVHGKRAFKLLDGGVHLLYLASDGVCLFDTRERRIVAKAEFGDIAWQWSGFALSPRVKLLALGCSARGEKDPIDGEYRYRNFVRVYNIATADIVCEQELPSDREAKWTVDFSEDGRRLRLASANASHVLELVAVGAM